MLIAWHPQKKIVYPLFSAHASEAGTAFLPDVCKTFEIQKLDVFLPKGTLLFLMSDGIHDYLPFVEEEKVYPNELKYRIRSLVNFESIFKDISLNAPLDVYMKAIIQTCLSAAENVRKLNNKPSFVMGDDLSILRCYLE
jgi:hypothetical protein